MNTKSLSQLLLLQACVIVALNLAAQSLHGESVTLSWTKASGPWDSTFDGSFCALAINPLNPDEVYIGCSSLGPGVFKSTDGGATWVEKNRGIEKLGFFSTNYPPISKLVISPSNPNILYIGTAIDDPLYAGGRGDIYRSNDSGESWIKVDGPTNWLGIHQLQGSVFGLDVDPTNPSILYAGVTGQGVFKSTDGGSTWSNLIGATAVMGAVDYFNVVRISPVDPNTVFVSGFTAYNEDVIPLPTRDFDTSGTNGIIPAGIRKSTNGGSSWSWIGPEVSLVVNPPLITSLAIEQSTGNLYLGTIGYQTPFFVTVGNKGFFKSTNSGGSWFTINSSSFGGLDSSPVYSMTSQLSVSQNGLYSSGGFPGVISTTDEGTSWTLLVGLPTGSLVTNISVLNQRIYVATSSGVYRATTGTISNPPSPTVASISPRILNTQPLGQTQSFAITGTNFSAASRLTFDDGINAPYADRVPATWTPTQLTYNIGVGPNPGTWTVKVVNDTVESLPYAFYTVSSGAQLTGLSIAGPGAVTENGNGQFTATALFSDGSTQNVSSSVSWSENSSVTSISSSGLLNAGSVNADTSLTVSASCTSGGTTKTASAGVIVVNGGSGGGSQTTDVIVNGSFESGTTPWAPSGYADVVALSYPHLGSRYAYVGNTDNATGSIAEFIPIPDATTSATLSFYLNVTTAETTTTTKFDTLTVDLATGGDQYVGTIATFSNLDKGTNTPGSYSPKSYNIMPLLNSYKGQSLYLIFSGTTDSSKVTTFRIDDVKLDITTPTPVDLTGLAVSGSSAIAEGGFQAYNTLAIFSDGTTQTVSPNSWSENSSATSIDANGFLVAGQVSADTNVTVSASYTFNGVTKQATKVVTVVDSSTLVTFTALAINGSGAMDEKNTAQYTATAIFSNGTTQAVTPTWSENSSATTISSNGLLTAMDVAGDTTVTLTASHTIGGVTRTATQSVLIVNGSTAPVFNSLEIAGPSSINENSSGTFSATAIFDDGSTQTVVPNWNENGSATSISIFGLLSAGEVAANTVVTVGASISIGGITHSASKSVTVTNVPDVTAPGLAISSPANGSTIYSSIVTVTGVASDASRGNSGVTSVIVNGIVASGGTATGAGSANWSADVTLVAGTNTITIIAKDSLDNTSQQQLTVTYGLTTYTMTISATNGSVAKSPDQTSYPLGSQVTLTATAAPGYQFAAWGGDTTGTTNTVTVSMNSNKSVTAEFVALSPAFHLGNVQVANGLFQFSVGGSENQLLQIESSTDLANWSDFTAKGIPVGGAALSGDFAGLQARRFYRAKNHPGGQIVLQPGPVDSQDIWTTSVYSYASGGSTPGGGEDNELLRVGGWGDLYYSLLLFDLSGLPRNPQSAVLYLYCINKSGGGTPMYLDRVSEAWNWKTSGTGRDRSRLWWANRPTTTQWIATEITAPVPGAWYAIDVTDLFKAWKNGTQQNFGLQLRPKLNTNNNFNEFYSADYAVDPTKRPKLVITP
jgi:List-Bact-rpt repeat protein/glucodextranase-like protein